MAAPEGRPTKYDVKFVKQAYKLSLLGSTDKDLASFFEVSESTIDNWKKEYPEFLESIKRGKEQADSNVANRLYKRAMGYTHKATKILQHEGSIVTHDYTEIYPPDTTAAIFWLKNRQPQMWRDRQEIKHEGIPEQKVTYLVSKPEDD